MNELSESEVFASRFWGFSPETHPVVMFGSDGHRDRLARMAGDEDVVLFVGTTREPTLEHERGRLLGLVQFARTPVETNKLVSKEAMRPEDFSNGEYKWPKAFPVTRAWRFVEPRPMLTQTLSKQLPMYATIGVVQLNPEDRDIVLNLKRVEVDFKKAAVVHGLENRQENLAYARARQTTGPVASDWTGEVSRNVTGEVFTYAMRFGETDIWKIGWAKDPKARLKDINKHVPSEHLGEEWKLVLQAPWPSGDKAFAMEQALLRELDSKRTIGERVRCPENTLNGAWYDALKT